MQSDEHKIVFNKNDHKGTKYISKTTFTLNFSEKEIKVIFSLN